MPQRFLRPGITTSIRFNSVDWQSQTFYIRLLTLVDDFGRYEGDPRILRSHIFPLGDYKGNDILLKTVENICEQVSASELVVFYQTQEGKKVLQVLRWQERPRAQSSRYPEFLEDCEQMFTARRIIPQNPASLVPRSSPSPSPLHPRSNVIASTQLRWSEAEGWLGKTDSLISELKTAYPACDIERQFLEMEQWLKANPLKAHKTNWRKFADNWLRRKQDRGGDTASNAPNGSKPRTLSFAERDRRIGQVRENRNSMFKSLTDQRTGAKREFTSEEKIEYEKLTKELSELDVCFNV